MEKATCFHIVKNPRARLRALFEEKEIWGVNCLKKFGIEEEVAQEVLKFVVIGECAPEVRASMQQIINKVTEVGIEADSRLQNGGNLAI